MILDEIIAHKYQEVIDLAPLNRRLLQKSQNSFLHALQNKPLAVIAEIKPASPAAGTLQANPDISSLVEHYRDGGADALSILTDKKYFHGDFSLVQQAKEMTHLPILCKEFIIDPKQIHMARSVGANACLLIVAAIDDNHQFQGLMDEIDDLGMDTVVEVFNEVELNRALNFSPKIIQINNRNLQDFNIDIDNANILSQKVPKDICVISASGISQPIDAINLAPRIDAALIGTALMRSANPKQFIKELKENVKSGQYSHEN